MGLTFSVLASGSSGNAMYIETAKTKLLIDAGLSGKKLEQLLTKAACDPSELDGIIVTHEHSDHIKGLGVMARRYKLPVYANEKTWAAMEPLVGTIAADQKFHFSQSSTKAFSDLDIQSFPVSHDAADPMFFAFHHEGRKLVLATDMGYVSDTVKGVIQNADMMVFESNHDMNMLRMGRYPWSVKRRILGDSGHVSNEDAAYALCDVIGERTKRIYLAHLSKDNNMKELARMTAEQILKEKGHGVGESVHLFDTDPITPTSIVTL